MNKFQKLAIGFTIIAASIASAVAAPSATRHSKLLSIKQRVMIDSGESRTSASLVSPTAHSSRAGLVTLTNAFAAIPLAGEDVDRFHAARVPRFNYDAFWVTMTQMQACEDQLAANAAAYSAPAGDAGEYRWYVSQAEPKSAKTYANMLMANIPTSPSNVPAQFTSGGMTACNNGGNPATFAAAATVREGVNNYALDSPEVIDYVTSQFWIRNSDMAKPLKQAVLDYLRQKEIEFAWVDVEFEYNHTSAAPLKRRVALSFQISRADDFTSTNQTRGSYLGSQLILAPDVTPEDASANVRTNHIDIKYTAYSQYPDFTIGNPQNNTFLKNLLTSGGFNQNGVMSWRVDQRGSGAISPLICTGISTCTPTQGEFRTTSSAYDPDFMRAGHNENLSAPYSLDNPDPLDDISGIKCLVKGVGSQRCRLDKHNVSSLMQYSNSITGTLDYLGRWEAAFETNPPLIEETGRNGIFDVCYGVEFQNSLRVDYWVRRPHWKLDLRWQQNAGIDYQIVEQKYEFEAIGELPNPVSYTTWAQGVADNNLTGTTNNYNVRSNGTPTTPENGLATNYSSVNMVGLDPQNFGMPDRQGAIIMNPFVTKVAPNGMLYNGLPNNWLMYRPINGLVPEETLVSRMIGTPIYKTAGIGASNALPRGWLGRGNDATTRETDFQCEDQNEPQVYAIRGSEQGVPSPTGAYGIPPDPYIPNGGVPFAGTTRGHKSGTRPDSTVPGEVGSGYTFDPCQISYVPWSNVDYSIITTGPLPDPAFVPPASCSAVAAPGDPPLPPPGPECYAPLNYYTKHVVIHRAQDLTYIGFILPACNEMCQINGNVKLCQRPYSRF